MIINQISVFIENRSGRIADIMSKLETSNVSIKALCLADTENFGILRIISENSGECIEKIRSLNIAASQKSVLCVSPSNDFPISKILSILAKSGIFVEYMYTCDSACEEKNNGGSVIICVSDEIAGKNALIEAGYADA